LQDGSVARRYIGNGFQMTTRLNRALHLTGNFAASPPSSTSLTHMNTSLSSGPAGELYVRSLL
jgi:hypothetical protein